MVKSLWKHLLNCCSERKHWWHWGSVQVCVICVRKPLSFFPCFQLFPGIFLLPAALITADSRPDPLPWARRVTVMMKNWSFDVNIPRFMILMQGSISVECSWFAFLPSDSHSQTYVCSDMLGMFLQRARRCLATWMCVCARLTSQHCEFCASSGCPSLFWMWFTEQTDTSIQQPAVHLPWATCSEQQQCAFVLENVFIYLLF